MSGTIWDVVRNDIEAGLGDFFTVISVEFVDPTPERPGAEFQNQDGYSAVVWRCNCRDDKTFPDLQPSLRHLVVEGITMAIERDGEWEFRRLIDWNGAVAALGETRHRRAVDHHPSTTSSAPPPPLPPPPPPA